MANNNAVDIVEWFDPYNLEHLKAFDTLNTTGKWPKDFLPPVRVMKPLWHYGLVSKMASAWLKFKLSGRTKL